MNESKTCLSPERLRELAQSDLPPQRWTELEEHLTQCDKCRRVMEQFDDDEQWQHEIQNALSAELSSDRFQKSALSGFEDSRPDADGSLQRVLSLLGPTDDPRMMGRIGPYEIVGVLGQGGMGVVFKGFDGALNRYVAIKMLLPHLATSGAARKRFAREAQAAAAVVNDHVMAIHNVAEWQGMPYLVMPYGRGSSLHKRLSDEGSLDVAEILRIGMQTAKGLAAAHAQGLVHRDVKPANILLDEGVERVTLTDFGLARAVDDISLTRVGTLAGTPQFMSPEQARGQSVDARSDLFSLGCVMYAMCTGHAPFRADSSYGVLRQITDTQPRSIRELNPAIPEWLERFVLKLLSKLPEDRFATALEVAALLEQCLAHIQQPTSVELPSLVATASTTSPSRRSNWINEMRSAVIKLPAWWLVFFSTLIGLAASLKNALGLPNSGAAIALVSICTGLAFVWGCVLAWAMQRARTKPIEQLPLSTNMTQPVSIGRWLLVPAFAVALTAVSLGAFFLYTNWTFWTLPTYTTSDSVTAPPTLEPLLQWNTTQSELDAIASEIANVDATLSEEPAGEPAGH